MDLPSEKGQVCAGSIALDKLMSHSLIHVAVKLIDSKLFRKEICKSHHLVRVTGEHSKLMM